MMRLRFCFSTILLALLGCQKSDPPPAPPPAPASPVTQAAPVTPIAPDPSVHWAELLSDAQKHLHANELADAKAVLEKLKADADRLGEEQASKLADLEADLRKREQQHAAESRATTLADARRLLSEGDLEAATRTADTVLNSGPSDDDRQAAGEVKKQVEEQRKARLRLKTAMRLLASDRRGDVKAAQEQLFAEQEAAWPLIVEATRGDNPVLAANALEMLRVFNQPPRAVPAMLAVLSRPQQQAVWPAAIRELHKIGQPGAGEPLLELALTATDEDVRSAALSALAGVVGPPPQTAIVLLPLVYQDGPALVSALAAVHHAVDVHRQHDLAALRGVEIAVSSEQREMLAGLGPRLIALAGITTDQPRTPAAENAMKLGIATRLIAQTPLTGVKVSRHSGEEPTGPATAVLDGQWSSAKPEHAWRYPLGGQSYIVLDLGREYTVTGVRLWNYNQPGANHRGWKDVDIYVDARPALLSPVATGLLTAAPPTADTTDYSTMLSVPFVRGRYVKLQARSYWRADAVSGLAEVQILGY